MPKLPLTALIWIALWTGSPVNAAKTEPPTAQAVTRQQVFKALWSGGIIDPDRRVVHLSHVCDLRIDERYYPVVDLQEIVTGAVTPRGINTIVILDPSLHSARRIEYTRERPLFCKDNQLYVWGDLMIDGIPSQGNAITFSNGGKTLELRHVEANDYPLPPSRDLGGKLQ